MRVEFSCYYWCRRLGSRRSTAVSAQTKNPTLSREGFMFGGAGGIEPPTQHRQCCALPAELWPQIEDGEHYESARLVSR